MFGKTLAGLRKKAGLTQFEVSVKMGVSRTRVKNMESADNVRLASLESYLGACGYSAEISIFTPERQFVTSIPMDAKIERLVTLRKGAGLTQAALAEKCRLSRSRIEQIENGAENISAKTLKLFVAGCGLEVMIGMRKNAAPAPATPAN
jgi:transcriptional regulator with XRE-family HTH domain